MELNCTWFMNSNKIFLTDITVDNNKQFNKGNFNIEKRKKLQ